MKISCVLEVLESTKSDEIFSMLQKVLKDLNLTVNRMRGQSYNGAANMTGSVNGVVTKFQKLEKRPVFIYCNGHLVNLATSDSIRNSKVLKEALDNAFEIIKLIV